MSLLSFPPEVTMQIIQKMNLFDRLNLSLAHTNLSPLCFDRSLQRKSAGTLTLNELRLLYEQSKTEHEKDQCFKSKVLDRLLIKNINEVVRLYVDPRNEQFVANGKILHSLGGTFLLEAEERKFSATFVGQFLSLLERAQGTLLLAFVDVEWLEEKHGERCARILTNKLERGQNVYCLGFCTTMWPECSCMAQIRFFMEDPFKNFTIRYQSDLTISISPDRSHYLCIDKRNSVANAKEMFDMINGDSLLDEKQHMGKFVAVVEAAALPGGWKDIKCWDCFAEQASLDLEMELVIYEPRWSNCVGCELK